MTTPTPGHSREEILNAYYEFRVAEILDAYNAELRRLCAKEAPEPPPNRTGLLTRAAVIMACALTIALTITHALGWWPLP